MPNDAQAKWMEALGVIVQAPLEHVSALERDAAPAGAPQGEFHAKTGAAPAAPNAKAAPKRTETPGYREPSWVRPSSSVATAPVHVGSLFFTTKDSTLGTAEDAKLHELAKAYGEFVRRAAKADAKATVLTGKVMGYADPRASVEPDNKKLSAERAAIVARLLTRYLAAESGVIEGRFEIVAKAGGALPSVAEKGPELEANSLAPLRRADIFLTGGVVAVAPAGAPAKPAPEPKKPEPEPEPMPPLEEVEHAYDRPIYTRALNKVIAGDIYAMAVQMYSALGVGAVARGNSMSGDGGGSMSQDNVVSSVWTAVSLRADLYHRELRSKFPQTITPTKPGWWDSLYTPVKMRPGLTAGQAVLEDKARRLKAWYVATLRYGKTYMDGPGKVLSLALEEIRKDNPDVAKMNAYSRQVNEYAYMIGMTTDLAKEVMVMAGAADD